MESGSGRSQRIKPACTTSWHSLILLEEDDHRISYMLWLLPVKCYPACMIVQQYSHKDKLPANVTAFTLFANTHQPSKCCLQPFKWFQVLQVNKLTQLASSLRRTLLLLFAVPECSRSYILLFILLDMLLIFEVDKPHLLVKMFTCKNCGDKCWGHTDKVSSNTQTVCWHSSFS